MRAVVELEECLRVAKEVGLGVIQQFRFFLHLFIRDRAWFSHVLEAVGAFGFSTSQDHDVVFTGLNREIEVRTTIGLRMSDLESRQIEPQSLSHRVW